MEPQKKDKSILVRLSIDEKEAIRKAAASKDVNISEYIRSKIFEPIVEQQLPAVDNTEYITSLKEQILFLQTQNETYQREQLDLLQKLLLLNTPKVEAIEHEPKKSLWKRIFKQS